MKTESPPNIHSCRRLTTPDNKQVDIDTHMVPLVQTLWGMGLETMACCQDIGESAAGLRDLQRTTPSGHGGFVQYYRGYAWLKMPLGNARKLLNALLNTPFRNRVTVQWQPGSWRMHVPLTYNEKNSIDLAYFAQIYFPAQRITELSDILADLSTDDRGVNVPSR